MGSKREDGPGFGWHEPRWRDADDDPQAEVEHDRRFRDRDAPGQRGAIDGRSIDTAETADERDKGQHAGGDGNGSRPKPGTKEPRQG